MDLGRRIHVIGTSGSGKTTVARALAAALGVPHVELDALHFRENWVERPDAEMRADVEAAAATSGWVMDGNYGRVGVRDVLWPLAETIVWIDLPRIAVMRQVIARTAWRWWSQEPLWHGNRESVRKLFTRESIVWWAWTTHRGQRANYERLLATPPCRVVRLRTRAEVGGFLAACAADDPAR
jgi:adenylate kinase family enzyme